MLRDNRSMYMAHVCCSDCVGVCGNVYRVAAVVITISVFSLGMLTYIVCLCKGV